MIIGFAKETSPMEKRVALTPAVIATLKKTGFDVVMETGAGEASGFSDLDYVEKGVKILSGRQEVFKTAEIILFVSALGANPVEGKADIPLFRKGQIIIGQLNPMEAQEDIDKLSQMGVAAFALELLPRISRAQSMDVLSSMATVAGYKVVLLAADHLPKMFPLLMTAAGTISPARVFVVGVGVAGLQAIATAKRLGAVVQAYDIRPAVKDQVESLGARFVELPLETSGAEASGGYARAMGEDFLRKQRELMTRVIAESDVVIMTASVPGKKAPVLATADMVRQMKAGSVIVDLAAPQGGNCEVTKPGQTTTFGKVTIIGPANLASTLPYDASLMYAKNITNFLLNLVKDDKPLLDSDDEIIRATKVTAAK